MSSLDAPLVVEVLPRERSGLGLFKLVNDFTFDLHEIGSVGTLVVPAGYITDFASIPRIGRWLFSTAGKDAKAALLHDYLLHLHNKEATRLFSNALKASGVSRIGRWFMVAFVFVATFQDFYL